MPIDGEAGSPKAATIRMAAEEMVQTYAARVIGGKAAPCMSHGLAWSYLRASYDQSHVRVPQPRSPYPP